MINALDFKRCVAKEFASVINVTLGEDKPSGQDPAETFQITNKRLIFCRCRFSCSLKLVNLQFALSGSKFINLLFLIQYLHFPQPVELAALHPVRGLIHSLEVLKVCTQ